MTVESTQSSSPPLAAAVPAPQRARLARLGVPAPARVVRLMREAIDRLGLDLTGLSVLTEAGSREYAVTAPLAALAGAAEVTAVTRDSRHGRAADNAAAATALAELCGVAARVRVITELDPRAVARADVVTNLGFVRPIGAAMVKLMKPTAVVPLMCEAWEWRPGDVELDACRERGVVVLGTNEDHPAVDVFRYSGSLGLKLLLEAGVELHKSVVVIVGRDRFAPVLADAARRAGATVHVVAELRSASSRALLATADALLVADYATDDVIVGDGGAVTAAELAALAPGICVVPFAGAVDVAALERAGVRCHPAERLEPRRMARTLAHLGPRPVIDLHAAGLKVGELAARARLRGLDADAATAAAVGHGGLAQALAV